MARVTAPPKQGREPTILSDSAETLVFKVLLAVTAFAASVLISRGLGPEGRGAYYLPVITAATMSTFCKLGLEHANVFLLATRGIPANLLSAQNGLVALVMGSVGILLVPLAPWALPALFADTPVLLLILAAITIPLSLHTQFSAGLLTLHGDVTRQFRAALLAGIVHIGLLLGLFAARGFAVVPVLGANLVSIAVAWALTVRPLASRWTPWIRWDWGLLRQTLRQSLVLHLGMVLYFLHFRLDMFMVKGLVGTAALGQYSLAVVLAETVLLVTESVAIAILPRQVTNSLEEAAAVALRGARTNGLVALALGCAWGAAGTVVIRTFFGRAFAPAHLPLIGLLPGLVFLSMERVCGGPTLRSGKPLRLATIYGASFLCNLGLNMLWIPAWGILGAALASSVSYGLEALVVLAWTARLARTSLRESLIPRRSDFRLLRETASQGLAVLRRAVSGGRPSG